MRGTRGEEGQVAHEGRCVMGQSLQQGRGVRQVCLVHHEQGVLDIVVVRCDEVAIDGLQGYEGLSRGCIETYTTNVLIEKEREGIEGN